MSDERKALLTPEGVYVQDEDGQGWTLLPGTEEHEYPVTHLTNEEAEKLFKVEMDVARLRDALQDFIGELVRIIHDWIANLVPVVWQAIQASYRVHPRPDYNTRPKCCTRAKTKRDRKPRRRER